MHTEVTTAKAQCEEQIAELARQVSPVAEPTKSITYQLRCIDEELINLQSACEQLKDRLQPVMSEKMEKGKDLAEPTPCANTCELHSTLKMFTDKIIFRRKDIVDIINRLEL